MEHANAAHKHRHRGLNTFVILAASLPAAVSLVPLGFVVYVTFASGWGTVSELVVRPRVGMLLSNTFMLLAAALPASAVLALALAWMIERTDLPGRPIWRWLIVAPLAVPAFVQSYAWNSVAPGFHGLWAAVGVSVLAYLPFVYLPISAQLRRLDMGLEETAAALGKTTFQVLFLVVLPQLRLALCGGCLLVALHLLAEYGLFVLTRYDTFATAIVDQFQSVYNGPAANLLGGVLVSLCLILLSIEALLRGDERYARVGPGSALPANRSGLGKWRWPATLLPLVYTALAIGVPSLTLLRWLALGGADVWRMDRILPALEATALLAFWGGALTVLAALPMAWLSVRAPSKTTRLLEAAHYYVGALPGVIVALSLVTVTVQIALPLYQTVWTLLIAYLLMFLPRALVGLRAGIALAPVELEHAAASLGRSPLRAVLATTVRLAAPGAAASGALVALGIANELTGTLMLAPNGTRTLATRFWSHASELNYAAAAPYALLMIAVSAPLVLLLRRDEYSGSKS